MIPDVRRSLSVLDTAVISSDVTGVSLSSNTVKLEPLSNFLFFVDVELLRIRFFCVVWKRNKNWLVSSVKILSNICKRR